MVKFSHSTQKYLGILKKYLPSSSIRLALRIKHRNLIDEINSLFVIQRGYESGFNWVELQCGTKFYGPKSSLSHRAIYDAFSHELSAFESDDMAILMEIVNRYKFPRNIPGESGLIPPKYKPLRDPLNDFRLNRSEREKLIDTFKPKNGDVFVDIGAYRGYGTIKAAQKVGDSGTVYAFEADKHNFELLKLNIDANNLKNVVLIPYAAGNVNDEMVFHSTNGTANSLSESTLKILGRENLNSDIVKTVRVDDVLEQYGHTTIDYLSITVNGSEHDVLNGMKNIISRSSGIRITLAGWYYVDKNKKVADYAMPILSEMQLVAIRGSLGRVLSWAGHE